MTLSATVASPPRSGSRIALTIVGAVAAVLAVVALAGGGALVVVHQTQRDGDGFYASDAKTLTTPTHALVSDNLDFGTDTPEWLFERPARHPPRERDRYRRKADLRRRRPRVAARRVPQGHCPRRDHRLRVPSVLGHHCSAAGRRHAGRPDDRELLGRDRERDRAPDGDMDVREGSWGVVVMNADGASGVVTDVSLAAKAGFLLWIGVGLLAAGAIVGVAAGALIYLGARTGRASAGATS